MSEEFKATVTVGPSIPPDDPKLRKAIGDGISAMNRIHEETTRWLADQGLTINDVGCVTIDPVTGKRTIHKGYFGP